jgi:hypothetical protein
MLEFADTSADAPNAYPIMPQGQSVEFFEPSTLRTPRDAVISQLGHSTSPSRLPRLGGLRSDSHNIYYGT